MVSSAHVSQLCALSAFAQTSEMVLINGKILTADAQFSVRQAIAVRDGKIAAVGTNVQVPAGADVYDATGKFALDYARHPPPAGPGAPATADPAATADREATVALLVALTPKSGGSVDTASTQ